MFEMYQDATHEWRWRLKAANGRIIADSGDGYKRKSACRHAINAVIETAARAAVELQA